MGSSAALCILSLIIGTRVKIAQCKEWNTRHDTEYPTVVGEGAECIVVDRGKIVQQRDGPRTSCKRD